MSTLYRETIRDIYTDVDKIKEQLKDAYWDNDFDIFTKKGFINDVKDKKNYSIILLNVNNVSELNKKHGYIKVNSMFKRIFNEIRLTNPNIIFGRCFSGYEILVYIEDISHIDRIKKNFEIYNLTFKYVIANSSMGNINENINFLINNINI